MVVPGCHLQPRGLDMREIAAGVTSSLGSADVKLRRIRSGRIQVVTLITYKCAVPANPRLCSSTGPLPARSIPRSVHLPVKQVTLWAYARGATRQLQAARRGLLSRRGVPRAATCFGGGVSMGLSSGGPRRARLGRRRPGVGLVVAKHGVDDVDAAAGEADQGGVVPLALGSFPVVVGAAGRSARLAKADKNSADLSAWLPRWDRVSPLIDDPDRRVTRARPA